MTHDRSTVAAHCAHEWCTTPHGRTIHPDDEDHRSDGVAFEATVRDADGTVRDTELEVGLLRRHDDAGTWFVIEDGCGAHLELALDSARRLLRTMLGDAALATALT